ncbi:hypothetical protein V6Z12_A07G086200 [Gossypium hirsutum]
MVGENKRSHFLRFSSLRERDMSFFIGSNEPLPPMATEHEKSVFFCRSLASQRRGLCHFGARRPGVPGLGWWVRCEGTWVAADGCSAHGY